MWKVINFWYLLLCFFSKGRLPKLQFLSWQLPKYAVSQAVPNVRWGPLKRLRLLWAQALRVGWAWGGGADRWGKNRLRKLALGKLHSWEAALWGNSLGMLSLGKKPLGSTYHRKYIWSIGKYGWFYNNIVYNEYSWF